MGTPHLDEVDIGGKDANCARSRQESYGRVTVLQRLCINFPLTAHSRQCAREHGRMSEILPIIHNGGVAAIVADGQAIIPDAVPEAELLAVKAKCLYALEIAAGHRPGPTVTLAQTPRPRRPPRSATEPAMRSDP